MVSAVLRVRPTDLLVLVKARIVLLVMVTVAAGYYMAVIGRLAPLLFLHTLVGTMLVAAGTNALNQVVETDIDRNMHRTRSRPLPAGRMDRTLAAVLAWALGIGGVVYMAFLVNPLAALLAGATLASYVFIYTPLKRKTSLATLVGAVPGALPIVGGWAAARGTIDPEAWALFALLFLWQLPHFLALAWLYREDYGRAGLVMLSVGDGDGRLTFRHATLYAAALLAVAGAPTLLGLTGGWYFFGAVGLSGWLLWASIRAAQEPSAVRARRLFLASVAYLPLVLLLMMGDKLP